MFSISGVKLDLILVLRSHFFEYLRETLHKHAFEHLEAARREKEVSYIFPSTVNGWLSLNSLKACDWAGRIVGACASPRSSTKTNGYATLFNYMFVHGGQYDTKYVTSEFLLRTAFVADQIWGFMPVVFSYQLIATMQSVRTGQAWTARFTYHKYNLIY